MVPKFSKKDIVNFNEETLYKEYKDYLDKDNDYLFKIFNSILPVMSVLKDTKLFLINSGLGKYNNDFYKNYFIASTTWFELELDKSVLLISVS